MSPHRRRLPRRLHPHLLHQQNHPVAPPVAPRNLRKKILAFVVVLIVADYYLSEEYLRLENILDNRNLEYPRSFSTAFYHLRRVRSTLRFSLIPAVIAIWNRKILQRFISYLGFCNFTRSIILLHDGLMIFVGVQTGSIKDDFWIRLSSIAVLSVTLIYIKTVCGFLITKLEELEHEFDLEELERQREPN